MFSNLWSVTSYQKTLGIVINKQPSACAAVEWVAFFISIMTKCKVP